jgi:PAS domain S-box-containing protein
MLGATSTRMNRAAPDGAERRAGRILQSLLAIASAWALFMVSVAVARGGFTVLRGIMGAGALLFAFLAASLALARAGRLRAAMGLFLSSCTSLLAAVLIYRGLRFGTHLVRLFAFPLVVAALFLGRRAAWTLFGVVAAVLCLAAARDLRVPPGPLDPIFLPPAGVLAATLLFFLLLTTFLDQIGGWLRSSLAEARANARERAENEERLRAVFESFPDAIVMTRADGLLLSTNAGFTELTGWRAEDLVGKTSADLGVWDDGRLRERYFRDVLAGKSIRNLELTFRRRDGTIGTGLLSGRTLTVQGQAIVLSMIRDITERERAEAERVRLRDRLQQAQKMETVGRLSSGIAHDFNNLLAVIRTCADLVKEQLPASSPALADVEELARAAGRGAALTRQLLSFSRQQDFPGAHSDATRTLREVCEIVPRLLGSHVSFQAFVPDGLGDLALDDVQLEQVLLNLCINARDAMADGGHLSVCADRTVVAESDEAPVSPGAYVTVVVRDSGGGMTDEVKGRLFEPFFTTKPAGVGTGLGLSTSRDMVREAGGALTFESTLGVGTAFTVWVPLAPELRVQVGVAQAVAGRATVLAVDDEPAVLAIVERILSSAGHRVLPASGATQALALAEREAVDALTTDLLLRDGNGAQIVEGVCRRHPGAGIVLTSGFTSSARRIQERYGHRIEFVPKPFSAESLLAAVDRALGRAPAEVHGEAAQHEPR